MARSDVKYVSFFYFKDAAIIHCHSGPPGNYQADMFYIAARFPKRLANVRRPLPTRFIGSPADGEAADLDYFEPAFGEGPDFVWIVEAFENEIEH